MSADLLVTELTAIARRFRLSAAASDPAIPQKISISVSSPDADANRPLTVSPSQLTEQLVDVPITISWVTKDVGFRSPTLPAPSGMRPDIVEAVASDIAGAQPIPGALSFNFVPGVIGRLTANLRLPIGQISTPAAGLPVMIDVMFRIHGPDGNLLSGVTTRFGTEPTRGPVVATDPNTPFAPLTAIIPVPFVRLTASPQLLPITIRATVQLSVTTPAINTGPIDLPPVTLSIPAIGVPTIALFFSRADFGRASTSRDGQNQLFIMIPRDLPLAGSVTTIENALQTLDTLLSALELTGSAIPAPSLGSLGAVAGFIRAVAAPSVPTRPPVLITQADGVADFYWDVLFFPTTPGRDTPDDKLRSLILIGAPGQTIECFNDKRFDIRQGQLNLVIQPDTIVAAVGDLNSLFPSSEPAGATNVVRTPTDFDGSSSSFADRLSSARFA